MRKGGNDGVRVLGREGVMVGGSEGGRETMGGSDVGAEWTSSIIISCVY